MVGVADEMIISSILADLLRYLVRFVLAKLLTHVLAKYCAAELLYSQQS
jgi:hypothetical protein